jgi:DMSO reductase anchor subunit
MSSVKDDKDLVETVVIPPAKQREWSWPAVANFVLGGAGAGFYLLSLMNMLFDQVILIISQPVLFGMLAPMIMGLGFVFLTTEAGRPSRGSYLLCRLKSAWISRETLAFFSFFPAVVLDQLFPHPVLKIWAAVSALVFMITQGFIVSSSRAVPTWNVSIMPLLFLSSGLVSGSGIVLLLAASGRLSIDGNFMLISVIFTIINLLIWIFYLRWSNSADFKSATEALRSPFMIFIVIALGHAFPILLLLLFQIRLYIGIEQAIPGTFAMISGFAIIIGITAQKAGIILFAGYIRKVALKF